MKIPHKKMSAPLLFSLFFLIAAPKEAKAFGMLEGALIGAGVGAVVGLVMSLSKKKPAKTPATPMENSAARQDSVQTVTDSIPSDSMVK